MKTISITIEGITPLLMNRAVPEDFMTNQTLKSKHEFNPEEHALKHAYWSSGKKKELVIPSEVIIGAMLNASSYYKIEKRSAKTILAGNVTVFPKEISLGTDKYEVDMRTGVIQKKARVLIARAMLPEWKATFKIIHTEKVASEVLKQILSEAGWRVGIMAFRPQKSGSFGTFKITKWEEEK